MRLTYTARYTGHVARRWSTGAGTPIFWLCESSLLKMNQRHPARIRSGCPACRRARRRSQCETRASCSRIEGTVLEDRAREAARPRPALPGGGSLAPCPLLRNLTSSKGPRPASQAAYVAAAHCGAASRPAVALALACASRMTSASSSDSSSPPPAPPWGAALPGDAASAGAGAALRSRLAGGAGAHRHLRVERDVVADTYREQQRPSATRHGLEAGHEGAWTDCWSRRRWITFATSSTRQKN